MSSRSPTPAWLPPDLPLPGGTYSVADLSDGGTYHRGLLAVPLSLKDFVLYAVGTWPGAGWSMGRGESEPGEAEDGFSGHGVAGAFRARSAYCSQNWTELYLVVGARYGSVIAPRSAPVTRRAYLASTPLV